MWKAMILDDLQWKMVVVVWLLYSNLIYFTGEELPFRGGAFRLLYSGL
jgi:hypothetical protein